MSKFVVKNSLVVNTNLLVANGTNASVAVTPGGSPDPSALSVTGTVAVNGALSAAGNVTFANSLGVTGTVNTGNGMVVVGNTQLNQGLQVGVETGGNLGTGTINYKQLYSNGIAIDGGPPPGSTMVFYQNTAPTGWTKVTTYDDMGLRVVSGNVSFVNTAVAWSTVMSASVVGDTTIDNTTMAAHKHSVVDPGHYHAPIAGYLYGLSALNFVGILAYGNTPPPGDPPGGDAPGGDPGGDGGDPPEYLVEHVSANAVTAAATPGLSMNTTGGGLSHNHTLTLTPNYVDVIAAIKN